MTRLHVESQFDPATSTFSHILWDNVTRHAALIDSVLDYDPKCHPGHAGVVAAIGAGEHACRPNATG